jgi:hypothetical protein
VNQSSVVSIADYGLHGFGVPILARERDFSFRENIQASWGPPSLLLSGYQGFPGGKAGGHEVNDLPPSSSKIEYEWSYTSTPPYMPTWCGQGKLYH